MKITDIKVWPTRVVENRSWIFIEVNTDEGITGVGESDVELVHLSALHSGRRQTPVAAA